MIQLTSLQAQPLRSLWGNRQRIGPRIVAALLALAAIAWLTHSLWLAKQSADDIGRLKQSVNQFEETLSSKSSAKRTGNFSETPSVKSPPSLLNNSLDLSPEQRRQINSIIRQLNTPWHDVFEQLERGTPKDISLISIEPDAKRGSVRLQAEARTLDSLLSYAARLQHQGVLGSLTYSKHETNEQDANKPIRLSVEYELKQLPVTSKTAPAAGAQK